MLLIGMKTSLITYPTKPITAKPIAQDEAIFKYSNQIMKNVNLPFLSGFEHFLKNLTLSFAKPFTSSTIELIPFKVS